MVYTHSDSESALLLSTSTTTTTTTTPIKPINVPKDKFHLTYIIYFVLGLGYLLPWNAFVTAVDYFAYLYPEASVDRIFAVVYMVVGFVSILLIVLYAHKSDSVVRINSGLALFVVSLLIVPLMDVFYIKGRVGLYDGFYVTVFAVALSGIADGLVQGGVIGSAGVLVSVLRIITKAVYPQDAHGLRQSANLYFSVGIVVMVICVALYNVAPRLPVIKYYRELKIRAVDEEKQEKGPLTGSVWRSTLWEIVGRIQWYGVGIILTYVVTLSIFPGYITEDVHSEIFKDWYPVLLITAYNVFDLVGKCLTPLYLLENAKVAIGSTVVRLVFFPLFLACLYGPKFMRTEIPVTILTSLLGLTNGYLTSVLMILAPKVVHLQHAETAGIVMVLFLVIGLAAGSVVSWFWVL
ncbi:hypothetical protein FEM48_ZijujUnG0055000 [Ziziphus jujuba var. spinosa]|uniref:Equilibrative nucleotide transporter 1 n=1 Tax=Ziziphus jujuba var. spinosa TaxID=714518 RepID=A0A978U8G9_ZIZJJ|nr:hypothetical protein FEM48_ZijujUnG0098200 [Ziziphus jujuba var. spinosa]KAH7511097.1 hypothetical protein FEM48_ZijujUnG0055000 [Ziziphus jujuba var. spinosa]